MYLKNADIRPPKFYPMLSQRMYKFIDKEQLYYMAQAPHVRGCGNLPGFAAMVNAIEYLDQSGRATPVETKILSLSMTVKDSLRERVPEYVVSPYTDAALHSGLTVFFPFKWQRPGVPLKDEAKADAVVDALRQDNIQIRSIGIPHASGDSSDYVLRISTAVFNTPGQIESLWSTLEKVLSRL